MLDFILAAGTTWFIGFFPLFEFYIAVPTGLALGLSPAMAVFWTVLGNYAPIPLIHFGIELLRRAPKIAAWLDRLVTDKWRNRIETGGPVIVFLLLPIIGTWALGATLKAAGLKTGLILFWPLVAITAYSAATAVLIQLGIDLIA